MRRVRTLMAVSAAALAVLVAGCAPQDDDSGTAVSASGPAPSASCTPDTLSTLTPGTLTIGTDKPAYTPWFIDGDPTNGKGFESAIAYAVAKQLGYDTSKVKWVTASFNSVVQPGDKPFDVDINEFSITDERKQAVDFSSSYYDVRQAVLTVKGSKAENATSIADLQKVKLGAQVGTTSYKTITDVIKPSTTPAVYDDNDKAKLALQNGQIDALVLDLPTALYIADAELKGGKVVGQLPSINGQVEQFGLVLSKGSKLTTCTTQAVDALRQDGTLSAIEKQWLTEAAKAPELS